MIITCGPQHDQRTLTVELPTDKPLKIAVMISGGIDSAILYYLLLQENKNLGNLHEITPMMIERKEGSKYFAKLVVAQLQMHFDIPLCEAMVVGDPSLEEKDQVRSGVLDVCKLKFDRCYVGVIEQQPEHMIGWINPVVKENNRLKYPMMALNKTHVIDLVIKMNQSQLFNITHTCNKHEIGRCYKCNGCNERLWGFSQLGLVDPGMI
jgi:7-cyano-7-deazaguanine synthase in queuosine biosynthesis